ncbi:MAG: putative DNA binding domain-containing protein [Candidatus Zixiibacteriota bacterium]|nr:MAG: putative DNA binding domain-containing protein [candidate division Zixibacteria bacterium]
MDNMENYQYFGEIITLINSRPYKFGIRFYSYKPGVEKPLIEEYYIYDFGDCIADKPWDVINFKLNIEKILWEGLFADHKIKLHKHLINFALQKIKNYPSETYFEFYFGDLMGIDVNDRLSGENLEKEILQFSYNVNNYCPGWALSIDDYDFNINANRDDIIQWADSLFEQKLLKKYRKDFKNRFTGGTTGGYEYKINREFKNKIEGIINSYFFESMEINAGNLVEILNLEESELFEAKGSLEFDIKRYIDGDKEESKKPELRKEVLKAIVAFLNSELKQSKYIIIGIIEKGKFRNKEKLIELTDKYLLFGINNDYDKNQWDGFLLKLSQLINEHISTIAHNYLKINRLSIDNKDLCLIHLGWFNERPNRWFYYDDIEFWVRIKNSTIKLEGAKMDEYKKSFKYRL